MRRALPAELYIFLHLCDEECFLNKIVFKDKTFTAKSISMNLLLLLMKYSICFPCMSYYFPLFNIYFRGHFYFAGRGFSICFLWYIWQYHKFHTKGLELVSQKRWEQRLWWGHHTAWGPSRIRYQRRRSWHGDSHETASSGSPESL